MLARLREAPELSSVPLPRRSRCRCRPCSSTSTCSKRAGLIAREKRGRTGACRLDAGPMEEAQRWLARYERFWSTRLAALEAFLAELPEPREFLEYPDPTTSTESPAMPAEFAPSSPRSPPSSPASPSSAASPPARAMLPGVDRPASAEAVVRACRHRGRARRTDPRVGGRYRLVMRAPGGEEHDVSGVFREVAANRKLVFTWAWRTTPERQSVVTVEFAPDGAAATALTLTHEQFADDDARDRHHHGWTGALDRFAAFVV